MASKPKSQQKHPARGMSFIAARLLSFRMTTQVFHWQTPSYAAHKTTDDLLGQLQDGIDELLETIQGWAGRRLSFSPGSRYIHRFQNIRLPGYKKDIEQTLFLLENLEKYLGFTKARKTRSLNAVLNLRDELVGNLQQTLYLLTFR